MQTVLEPRSGEWDALAVTTGPLARWKNIPIMFYAGTDTAAAWRIGWAIFDDGYQHITERCDLPLLPARNGISGGTGLLVASALPIGAQIWLYGAGAGSPPFRAVLRSKGD